MDEKTIDEIMKHVDTEYIKCEKINYQLTNMEVVRIILEKYASINNIKHLKVSDWYHKIEDVLLVGKYKHIDKRTRQQSTILIDKLFGIQVNISQYDDTVKINSTKQSNTPNYLLALEKSK